MKGSLLLYNLKLNCLIFFYQSKQSLIIFIRTYTVNYRNALDRLHVHMNIILCSVRSFEANTRIIQKVCRPTDSQRICISYFVTFEHSLLQLKFTWSSICSKPGFHCRGIIDLGLL